MKRWKNIIWFLWLAMIVQAQNVQQHILEDIYSVIREDEANTMDYEALQEHLTSLMNHPINLNHTSAEELQQLPFLTEEQIDQILLYAAEHPFRSVYELRLVPSLHTYDIRDLLPFVNIEAVQDSALFPSARQLKEWGKSTLTMRVDARNLEKYTGDPVYTSLKYRYQASNRLYIGLTAERDPGEPIWSPPANYGADFYSGYVQLNHIGAVDKLLIGDYTAGFGQGLTMNMQTYKSKRFRTNQSANQTILQRYTSTREYSFLRGAAARCVYHGIELVALYSYRHIDADTTGGMAHTLYTSGSHRTEHELDCKRTLPQHVAAVHAGYRFKNLKLGLTAAATFFEKPIHLTEQYYRTGAFQGKHQWNIGADYQYAWRHGMVYGETSVAENSRWGFATVNGLRLTPLSDLAFSLSYRYYSATYDNLLANGLSEQSRPAGEQGLLMAFDCQRIRDWRLSAYLDIFHLSLPAYGYPMPSSGYDADLQVEYRPEQPIHDYLPLRLQMRLSSKQKLNYRRHALSLRLTLKPSRWHLLTQVDANLYRDSVSIKNYPLTAGIALLQDMGYQWEQPAISLSVRAGAYYIPQYNNRMYIFEPDVVSAYGGMAPMRYGQAFYWHLLMNYLPAKFCSLALRVSQSVSFPSPDKPQPATDTDIHFLVRFSF